MSGMDERIRGHHALATAGVVLGAALAAVACAMASCGGGGEVGASRDAGATAPVDTGFAEAAPFFIEADNPTIPVGLDAYRMWAAWPSLRLGTRVNMRSTYDRSGGNEGADASHFLRLTSATAVALDLVGPGVVSFVRFNHWHGSPWHFDVDGQDVLVEESNTASPDTPTADAAFIPAAPFPAPLALTWPTTSGADLIGVPIAFTRSFSLDLDRTHYGTGYFIYQSFPEGAHNLSQPLEAWTGAPPSQDVIDLVNRSGQDIAPTSGVDTTAGTVPLPATGAVTLLDAKGPATLRALELTVPIPDAAALGAATLRVTWDDRPLPSIEAPVALFFGTGSLYNRTGREYLVKAFPVSVRFAEGNVTFAVYFPMPFFHGAHLELEGAGTSVPSIKWQASTEPLVAGDAGAAGAAAVGYLHATYVDQGTPVSGKDLVLLDTSTTEGGGAWCGSVVGTSFTFSDRAVLTTLEGDPRFFFDDSRTPQVQGTGTEEWGGGGDYWGGQTTTLPFYGHPVGAPDVASAESAEDQIESAYRFLLADLMPFGKNARVQLEHGGMDDSVEHYRTLDYWYGLPGACLVETDSLHVSDLVDEAAHEYTSKTASGVDTLTTRYEWGVDHVGSAEIYPATTDTGRHMTGTSELSLAIAPANFGVLLRRTLDYGFPDQRAAVFVAPDDGSVGAFQPAGTWYLAGSNACVYSNPPGELDPFMPAPEASNRRWRDDEFLIPRALTEGHSRIRVRLVYTPSNTPLTPSTPQAAQAWSEYRYAAYAWVLPDRP